MGLQESVRSQTSITNRPKGGERPRGEADRPPEPQQSLTNLDSQNVNCTLFTLHTQLYTKLYRSDNDSGGSNDNSYSIYYLVKIGNLLFTILVSSTWLREDISDIKYERSHLYFSLF